MTKQRAIILGAGGLGRFMSAYLNASNEYEVVGFTEANAELYGSTVQGIPVMGPDSLVAELWERHEVDCAFLGLGEVNMPLRQIVFERLNAVGIPVPTFLHPTAFVAPTAKIGNGVVVLPLAVIEPFVTVGDNVLVGAGAVVAHDCVLHDHSYLAAGVVLSGAVIVGKRAMLGSNCTATPKRVIGDDCVVGAGATIARDVGSGETVAGPPAWPLSQRKS